MHVYTDGLCLVFQMAVDKIMAVLWLIFQPLLFGLIGAEIDVTKIQPTTIGNHRLHLCIFVNVHIIWEI